MQVTVVDYRAGNIRSVLNAFARIGIEAHLTNDKKQIAAADRVVFPGQGEASHSMAYLRETGLDMVLRALRQPVLGICIGLQLFCDDSEEGQTPCMGIFDGLHVRRFASTGPAFKVPHMGWNDLTQLKTDLFKGVKEGDYCYFVHSYYAPLSPYTIARCDYMHPFSAALHKGNFYATQFHPEKSGAVGERILRNFIELP